MSTQLFATVPSWWDLLAWSRPYTGSHRDDSIAADRRCDRRDRRARLIGQFRRGRHSAEYVR